MARYMKKGSLGMMVEAAGGASDPEVAEIRLSPAEYSALLERIQAAEQARSSAELDAERRESAAYGYADAQIRKYKENIDIVRMSQKETEQTQPETPPADNQTPTETPPTDGGTDTQQPETPQETPPAETPTE